MKEDDALRVGDYLEHIERAVARIRRYLASEEKQDAVEVEDRVYFPHSLGIFYQALTQFLGFPNYGDEYKVMGLARLDKAAF